MTDQVRKSSVLSTGKRIELLRTVRDFIRDNIMAPGIPELVLSGDVAVSAEWINENEGWAFEGERYFLTDNELDRALFHADPEGSTGVTYTRAYRDLDDPAPDPPAP